MAKVRRNFGIAASLEANNSFVPLKYMFHDKLSYLLTWLNLFKKITTRKTKGGK